MTGENKIRTNIVLDDNGREYLEAGETFEIVLYNLRNPISLRASSSFQIFLLTVTGQYIISEQSEGIIVQNTEVGEMESLLFQSSNPNFGEESTFRVEVEPNNKLPPQAFITVYFPSSIPTSGSTIECIGIQNLDEELNCVYDEATHSITFQTGEEDENDASKSITFEIHGFMNPAEAIGQIFEAEPQEGASELRIATFDKDMTPIDEMSTALEI